jgi:biotin transporter BioY
MAASLAAPLVGLLAHKHWNVTGIQAMVFFAERALNVVGTFILSHSAEVSHLHILGTGGKVRVTA